MDPLPWRSCTRSGWTSRGRPTCSPSRWTSCVHLTDDEPEPESSLLGDVVLCPEIAATQARTAGHSTADELYLLCAHGILHLLGYDHAEPDEEREMFALQGRLVADWHERRVGERS